MRSWLILILILPFLFSFCTKEYWQDKMQVKEFTEVGQKVPDFTVETLEGDSIHIRDLEGNVVLITFFASWCWPCIWELQSIKQYLWPHDDWKDFKIIAIAVDKRKKVTELKEKHDFQYQIALDPKKQIYHKFATRKIPRTFIIDKSGIIQYQSLGFSQGIFLNMLDKLDDMMWDSESDEATESIAIPILN